MTVISDERLRELQETYVLVDPLKSPNCIQPNSIDLHLGSTIKFSQTPPNFVYDIRERQYDGINYVLHDLRDREIILMPKRFCLAVTLETVYVPPYLSCTLEGRSSIGRIGLSVQNAGRVDSGWNGRLTCELFNAEEWPIKLFYGMPLAQVVYSTCTEVEIPYGDSRRSNKYLGDGTATPSKLWQEYQK